MTREILTFGDEALRRKAQPVAVVDDAIRELISDMLETMRRAQGLGLAAEQIGRDEAVCVVEVPRDAEMPQWVDANAAIEMPLALINPRIESSSGKCRSQEGCLSFPEVFAQIVRAESATVSYLDAQGVSRRIEVGGMLARAILHEIDHLNGVLLIDRMSPAQRVASAGTLRQLRARAKRRL